MNLQTARSILIRDRMDWRKPRLPWLPENFYRQFRWSSYL